MKKTLFGILAMVAIGCNTASTDVMQRSALPKTIDEDSTASIDIGPWGTGFDGDGVGAQHHFHARVLETIGMESEVVPLRQNWYDTVSVNLRPFGWHFDIPDSLWHSIPANDSIPVRASRELKIDETGLSSGKTDWKYVIDWDMYYRYAWNKKFDIKLEPATSQLLPFDSINVADQFYGN